MLMGVGGRVAIQEIIKKEIKKLVRTFTTHILYTKRCNLVVWLKKKEEAEEESNSLTVLRNINRTLRHKTKSKIRINIEGLAFTEGPAALGGKLIMMT